LSDLEIENDFIEISKKFKGSQIQVRIFGQADLTGNLHWHVIRLLIKVLYQWRPLRYPGIINSTTGNRPRVQAGPVTKYFKSHSRYNNLYFGSQYGKIAKIIDAIFLPYTGKHPI
jgi:hypothetical protein